MKYISLVSEPNRWFDLGATGEAIVAEWRRSGDPASVVWSEAYAEFAAACQFRFPAMDGEQLAESADVLAGGILMSARTQGLEMPDDWLRQGGGADQLRRAVWGGLIEGRVADLDIRSAVFADMSDQEISAMLERVSGECRALARRAALTLVQDDNP